MKLMEPVFKVVALLGKIYVNKVKINIIELCFFLFLVWQYCIHFFH